MDATELHQQRFGMPSRYVLMNVGDLTLDNVYWQDLTPRPLDSSRLQTTIADVTVSSNASSSEKLAISSIASSGTTTVTGIEMTRAAPRQRSC